MSEETWNTPAKNAFFMYSVLLKLFGVWPLVANTLFLKFRVFLELTDLAIGLCGEVGKLLTSCGTKDTIMDSLFSIAFFTLGMSKGLLLHLNRRKLAIVLLSAFNDWDVVQTKRYNKMMLENSNFCNTLAKWFYICGIITMAFQLIKALFYDEYWVENEDNCNGNLLNTSSLKQLRNYYLPGGCVYEGYGDSVYYTVLLNQGIQVALMSMAVNGCDTTYVAMTDHLCTQCQILKIKFSEFGQFDDMRENKRQLNKLIAKHQDVMKIAGLLEDIFSPIIFIQMAMTVMIVSVGGYSLLMYMNEGNFLGVTKAGALILFMLLESYIFTFPADNLQCQAEQLQESLYDSAWYKMTVPIKEDIVFMMMRISLPPYITAGKFFYMTRRSYMDVIKTAASYLSVLRIMLE